MFDSVLVVASQVMAIAPKNIAHVLLDMIAYWVGIAGGMWGIWGVVTFATGLHNNAGPQIQSGLWGIIGGGLIIAAAALFKTIVS